MIRRPPSSTRTDALFPYTTLFRSGEADLAADRVAQVDLTLDLIEPVRAVRVLDVRHVRVGARVERIDDHLALDRTGDFGTANFQRLRHRRDLPVAFAHAPGFRPVVRQFAGIDPRLPRAARLHHALPPRPTPRR